MENRSESRHPIEAEHWDEFVREPLPRKPQPPQSEGRAILLSTVAVLLVVMLAGASVIVVRDLRTKGARTTHTRPAPHATIPSGTPTPVLPSDPKDNGWTQVTQAGGAIAFSASSPRHGDLTVRDVSATMNMRGQIAHHRDGHIREGRAGRCLSNNRRR